MSESRLSIPFEEVRDYIKSKGAENFTDEQIKAAMSPVAFNAIELLHILEVQDSLCKRCGYCCVESNPIDFDKNDIRDAAKSLGVSKGKLTRLGKTTSHGIVQVKGGPCPFYDSAVKSCRIYPVRPNACRLYPAGKPLMQSLGYTPKPQGGIEIDAQCPAMREAVKQLILLDLQGETEKWREQYMRIPAYERMNHIRGRIRRKCR